MEQSVSKLLMRHDESSSRNALNNNSTGVASSEKEVVPCRLMSAGIDDDAQQQQQQSTAWRQCHSISPIFLVSLLAASSSWIMGTFFSLSATKKRDDESVGVPERVRDVYSQIKQSTKTACNTSSGSGTGARRRGISCLTPSSPLSSNPCYSCENSEPFIRRDGEDSASFASSSAPPCITKTISAYRVAFLVCLLSGALEGCNMGFTPSYIAMHFMNTQCTYYTTKRSCQAAGVSGGCAWSPFVLWNQHHSHQGGNHHHDHHQTPHHYHNTTMSANNESHAAVEGTHEDGDDDGEGECYYQRPMLPGFTSHCHTALAKEACEALPLDCVWATHDVLPKPTPQPTHPHPTTAFTTNLDHDPHQRNSHDNNHYVEWNRGGGQHSAHSPPPRPLHEGRDDGESAISSDVSPQIRRSDVIIHHRDDLGYAAHAENKDNTPTHYHHKLYDGRPSKVSLHLSVDDHKNNARDDHDDDDDDASPSLWSEGSTVTAPSGVTAVAHSRDNYDGLSAYMYTPRYRKPYCRHKAGYHPWGTGIFSAVSTFGSIVGVFWGNFMLQWFARRADRLKAEGGGATEESLVTMRKQSMTTASPLTPLSDDMDEMTTMDEQLSSMGNGSEEGEDGNTENVDNDDENVDVNAYASGAGEGADALGLAEDVRTPPPTCRRFIISLNILAITALLAGLSIAVGHTIRQHSVFTMGKFLCGIVGGACRLVAPQYAYSVLPTTAEAAVCASMVQFGVSIGFLLSTLYTYFVQPSPPFNDSNCTITNLELRVQLLLLFWWVYSLGLLVLSWVAPESPPTPLPRQDKEGHQYNRGQETASSLSKQIQQQHTVPVASVVQSHSPSSPPAAAGAGGVKKQQDVTFLEVIRRQPQAVCAGIVSAVATMGTGFAPIVAFAPVYGPNLCGTNPELAPLLVALAVTIPATAGPGIRRLTLTLIDDRCRVYHPLNSASGERWRRKLLHGHDSDDDKGNDDDDDDDHRWENGEENKDVRDAAVWRRRRFVGQSTFRTAVPSLSDSESSDDGECTDDTDACDGGGSVPLYGAARPIASRWDTSREASQQQQRQRCHDADATTRLKSAAVTDALNKRSKSMTNTSGARTMLLFGSSILFVANLLIAIPTYPSFGVDITARRTTAVFGVLLHLLAVNALCASVFYELTVQLFPPEYQAKGATLVQTCFNATKAVESLLFPIAVQFLSGGQHKDEMAGVSHIFTLFAVMSATASIIGYYVLHPSIS